MAAAPLYERTKRAIRTAIEQGEFPAGGRLPAEHELAQMMGVSRITLRRAVEDLMAEGLLVRRHGVGTFVLPPKINRNILRYRSFTSDSLQQGLAFSTRLVRRERVPAVEDDTEPLMLEAGEEVIVLERLRVLEGQPVLLETSRFPARYDFLLRAPEAELASLTRLMEQEVGKTLHWNSWMLELSYAGRAQAALLEVTPGCAMLLGSTVGRFDVNTPGYLSRQLFSGERYKIAYDAGDA